MYDFVRKADSFKIAAHNIKGCYTVIAPLYLYDYKYVEGLDLILLDNIYRKQI